MLRERKFLPLIEMAQIGLHFVSFEGQIVHRQKLTEEALDINTSLRYFATAVQLQKLLSRKTSNLADWDVMVMSTKPTKFLHVIERRLFQQLISLLCLQTKQLNLPC